MHLSLNKNEGFKRRQGELIVYIDNLNRKAIPGYRSLYWVFPYEVSGHYLLVDTCHYD